MPGWPSVKPNRFRHLKWDAWTPTWPASPGADLDGVDRVRRIGSGRSHGGRWWWCSDGMESPRRFGRLTTTQKNVVNSNGVAWRWKRWRLAEWVRLTIFFLEIKNQQTSGSKEIAKQIKVDRFFVGWNEFFFFLSVGEFILKISQSEPQKRRGLKVEVTLGHLRKEWKTRIFVWSRWIC